MFIITLLLILFNFSINPSSKTVDKLKSEMDDLDKNANEIVHNIKDKSSNAAKFEKARKSLKKKIYYEYLDKQEQKIDKYLSTLPKFLKGSRLSVDENTHNFDKEKRLLLEQRIGYIGMFFGVSIITGVSLGLKALKDLLDRKMAGLQSDSGPLLKPNNTESSILSNAQSASNVTKQSEKKEISHGVTELTQNTTSKAILLRHKTTNSVIQKYSKSAIKKGLLNIKHAHSPKKKTTIYIIRAIVVVLLFIAAVILALGIYSKPKKKDLLI